MSSYPASSPFDSRLYPQPSGLFDLSVSVESMYKSHYYFVEPQPKRHISPFWRIGFANSEPWIEFERAMEDISLEALMSEISQRFFSISTKAEAFLRSNPKIVTHMGQVLKCLDDFLVDIGVPYNMISDFWQDSEAPDFEALEVIVKVDIADYDEILRLWKAIDRRVYETLGSEAKENIILMFERL